MTKQKATYGQRETPGSVCLNVKTDYDQPIAFSIHFHNLGQTVFLDLEDVESLITQLIIWLDQQ